jgi:hypothetical protein
MLSYVSSGDQKLVGIRMTQMCLASTNMCVKEGFCTGAECVPSATGSRPWLCFALNACSALQKVARKNFCGPCSVTLSWWQHFLLDGRLDIQWVRSCTWPSPSLLYVNVQAALTSYLFTDARVTLVFVGKRRLSHTMSLRVSHSARVASANDENRGETKQDNSAQNSITDRKRQQ